MNSAGEQIRATTRYCAVYGHPVKHSASPVMHNAAMAELGLDWRYLAFDVRVERLRDAIRGAGAMKFIGLNLTVPHKLEAVKIVDVLDESARTWGAVNTVLFEGLDGDRWTPLRDCDLERVTEVRSVGFNTDAEAITRSIEEDLSLKVEGSTVLMLGAGGAGRTAALKLASHSVRQLHLINRSREKAAAIAQEIENRFPGVAVKLDYPAGKVDLVLNATSLGLKAGDPLPIDLAQYRLENAAATYDMIYKPAETGFLKAARAAGCRTANGLGMLLHQGAKALEIWSGRAVPLETMRAALQKHIYG